MHNFTIAGLQSMISPDTFCGPQSPGVVWLGELYRALKPLTKFYLPNGEDAVYISIRTDGGCCTEIEPDRDYTWDRKAHSANADSKELGWWVCDILVYHATEVDERAMAVCENFYSGDFINDGDGLKQKLQRILEALHRFSGLPQFTPERIKRALDVFSAT